MMAPHQTVIRKKPPIILLSVQTRPTDQALNHEMAKFRINRRKSISYKIHVPDLHYMRRRYGSLRRFCPTTFSICTEASIRQIEERLSQNLAKRPWRLC